MRWRSRLGTSCTSFTWPPAYEPARSEEHTSELQSQSNLVCRLLLEKKKHHTKSHRVLHQTIVRATLLNSARNAEHNPPTNNQYSDEPYAAFRARHSVTGTSTVLTA